MSSTAIEKRQALEPEVIDEGGEVIEASEGFGLLSKFKVETDIQITTAKRFPRSPQRFYDDLMTLASLNREVAESCVYAKPTGKKLNEKTNKWEQQYVEGPSIGFANIVAATYQNILSIGEETGESERSVEAQALAWDLERNYRVGLKVRSSIWSEKNKKKFPHDVIISVGQGTISKARRNTILAVVPKPLWWPAYQKAKALANGEGQPFEERAKKAFEWFKSKGVKDAEIYTLFEVDGPKALTEQHLSLLTGFKSAITNEEESVESIFRQVPEPTEPAATKAATIASDLKAKADAAKAPKKSDAKPSILSTEGGNDE